MAAGIYIKKQSIRKIISQTIDKFPGNIIQNSTQMFHSSQSEYQ